MSTLKTNNLEHLDAPSPNITLGIGGGVNISGIATAVNGLRIGSDSDVDSYRDSVIGFGTDETNKKISIGSTGQYLQRHGIGVYNPHTLGLRNGILVHNSTGYNNNASYRAAAFKAVGASGNGLGISTDANDNGLSGTLNAYIKFDGSALFTDDVVVQNSSNTSEYLTISYQGIDFQNTGAGSSTTSSAHLLDDYEEGTWTPVFSGNTTAGTYTYGTQIGKYTKVGNKVTAWCHLIDITTGSAGSGATIIKGLPFAGGGGVAAIGSLLLEVFDLTSTSIRGVHVVVADSATNASLRVTRDGLTDTNIPITDKVNDTADVKFCVTYTVS